MKVIAVREGEQVELVQVFFAQSRMYLKMRHKLLVISLKPVTPISR